MRHNTKSFSLIGEAALDAYFQLPGVSDVDIRPDWPMDAVTVVDIGLPLSFLRGCASAEKLLRHVSERIRSTGVIHVPNDSVWSEIQAGALVRNLGSKVEFVKTVIEPPGMRTPDIRAWGTSGRVADIEVCRAETRSTHRRVNEALSTLSAIVKARDFDWHLLLLFSDATDDVSLQGAIDAVTSLQPGHEAGVFGRWYARAVSPNDREILAGGEAVEQYAPDWWDSTDASAVAINTVIGARFSPYVMIQSLYPKVAYINPIQRKADRNQRDSKNPFVIAIDSYALPRAHTRVAHELRNFFPIWKHVSGVFLFDYRPWYGFDNKQWVVSFYENPHAEIQAPKELFGTLPCIQHPMIFNLSL